MTANFANFPIVKESRITIKTRIDDCIKTVVSDEWTGKAADQTAEGPEANNSSFVMGFTISRFSLNL
jgi:hypothetical protein